MSSKRIRSWLKEYMSDHQGPEGMWLDTLTELATKKYPSSTHKAKIRSILSGDGDFKLIEKRRQWVPGRGTMQDSRYLYIG